MQMLVVGEATVDAPRQPVDDRQAEVNIEGEEAVWRRQEHLAATHSQAFADEFDLPLAIADMLDDAQFARLLEEAEKALRPFVGGDGSVAFAAPAHIVTVTAR